MALGSHAVGYLLAYYLVTTSLLPRYYLVTSSLHMASRWLWVALPGHSAFCLLHSALPPSGFARHSASCILHSAFASGWFPRAVRCWMLDVGCWMFGVHHKPPEYKSPPAPPSGWSRGALDKPWTYPGTIERSANVPNIARRLPRSPGLPLQQHQHI